MSIIYDILVFIFHWVIRGFFREVKTRGQHKIPLAGPVIFCVAPHANQFVDPVMLLLNCKRRVGFLAAKKSMDKPHIGIPGRIAGAIPVVRPQDLVQKGQGKLLFNPEAPSLFQGEKTSFKKQLHPRAVIKLTKDMGQYEVVEVVSDTEVRIKKPIVDTAVLEYLAAEKGVDYKVIPHVDQSEMFDAVTERLERGGCVGIFPEGGSHDRPELLPLKAGVTIMALGAMAKNPWMNVQIVPVGLNYFHADKFRSRAVIEFGDPIQIPSEMVEQYSKGGAEKRAACGLLLDTIATSLKAITTNAPDYNSLMVVQATRRLYKPPHKRLNLDETLHLSRRIAEGYVAFKDHPRVKELTTNVLEYNRLLSYYGIRDHQVQRTAVNRLSALTRVLARSVELAFLSVCALPGVVLAAPIWYTARRVASAKMVEAKAGSNVKIWGKDVVATWKVLTTLGLIPLVLAFYSLSAFLFSSFALDLDRRHSLMAAGLTLLFLPTLAWATIHMYDHGADIFKSLRPLWMAVIAGSSAQPLRDIRDDLQERIARLIDDLGPQLYGPDFEQSRIVKPEDVDLGLRMAHKLRRGTLDPTDFRWDEIDESEFFDEVFLFKEDAKRKSL
ncbi:hypothetical protein PhCBS80983_g03341 [Powellomyces hirtus]|uniref:Phospholipid/glycerol acyltransferase domain-containing protein n=1 Tax=Powellomyces hirtus TaxID=109895 RepID=A0A507E1Z4_9FUNG|nr:hypothetical protein PhCBS80983_g03341 [Powellomyces hirtus]